MSNIRITQRWVDEHKPCIEALKKYKHLIGKSVKRVMEELIKNDDFDYDNWLITEILKKDDLVQYAIYSAELVLHIYEKKYPGDTRPREAIKAAKKYSEDKSKFASDAVAYAASAASAAAYSAYSAAANAVDAAYSAYSAASAAADAAYSAASAAADAASAAADAAHSSYAAASAAAAANAASATIRNDILYYGLRLILGNEKLKGGQAKNQDGSGSGICCGD
jgi:hypothetical protein